MQRRLPAALIPPVDGHFPLLSTQWGQQLAFTGMFNIVHILEIVVAMLLCLAGIDLCLLDGEYTYWILSAASSVLPY